MAALEYQLFNEVRLKVAGELHRIQTTAQAVARLDVLCSFAETAQRNKYSRPLIDMKGGIVIKNGRHPVVEAIQDAPFVPNDTLLDSHENRVALITGPNMAGKSTFMRQTALIVLMAQIGSFVPAESATIGDCGQHLHPGGRVGRSGLRPVHLHGGDERRSPPFSKRDGEKPDRVRRDRAGTSTFDGMSIARAVLEYVVKKWGGQGPFRHPLS